MKARLAVKEYGYRSGISTKERTVPADCTLHGHDFYEIDIILYGKADSTLNGEPVDAVSGTVFLLTPEDFHDYTANDKTQILGIQFFEESVDRDLLQAILSLERRAFTPLKNDFDSILSLFRSMQELRRDSASAPEIMKRLLEAILLLLAESPSSSITKGKRKYSDVGRALVYIHEHFKENPSLSEVAALLHLNEHYFCKKFKDYTQKSYKSYLKQRKLLYARQLLLSTSLSLIEISERSGYGSQAHFNREFKEYFGKSPSAVRKE